MSAHTPEPWFAVAGMLEVEDDNTPDPACCYQDLYGQGERDSPLAWANAQRIAACVNYCAGMTADQLTEDSAEIVREDRDRLLAALKDVLRIAKAASIGITGNQPRIAHAEAVIAGR